MKRTRMLTMMAVFVAIGTIGSQFLWFPAGIAKAYPVQHAINVMAAVMLGPGPAVAIAFMIALLRILLGIGSILAFPGGMIGAFLAGYLYKKITNITWAAVGEIIGTGMMASLFSVPFAKLLMGSSVGTFFYMPSFLISSISGSLIGGLIVARMKQVPRLQQVKARQIFADISRK